MASRRFRSSSPDPLGVGAAPAVYACGYSWEEASPLDATDVTDRHGTVFNLPAISKLGLSAEALRKHVERRVVPKLRKQLQRQLPAWARAR